MIALQDRKERKELRESHPLQHLAEAALARYGLAGAKLDRTSSADGQDAFHASFPIGATQIHHYLGRLAGKSFTLRVTPATEESREAALAWAKEAAALLRDTDADAPEPIPACDGSLVTLVALGADAWHCVLFR